MSHRSATRAFAAICALMTFAMGWVTAENVWPEAAGDTVKKKNGTVIDASNSSDGYIMGKHKEAKKRLKFRLELDGDTYTYDLNQDGEFDVFPLQMGNGKYNGKVFKQISGTKYSQESSQNISVKLKSENAPFLCPNQYVWYTEKSPAVLKSDELCGQLTTDKEKFDAVRAYIRANFTYNYLRALTVQSGYLPDLDATFNEKSGICFDLAGIVACMLRVQGMPTKVVIGYADKNYHAWNMVLVDGEYIRIDLTSELIGARVAKYSDERFY